MKRELEMHNFLQSFEKQKVLREIKIRRRKSLFVYKKTFNLDNFRENFNKQNKYSSFTLDKNDRDLSLNNNLFSNNLRRCLSGSFSSLDDLETPRKPLACRRKIL